MGKNRSTERQRLKIKLARLKKQGKMTSDQIETDRYKKVSSYDTYTDKGKYDSVTVMPDGDEMPSGRHVVSARGPVVFHKSVLNTGYDRRIHSVKPQPAGTLFRTRTGGVFVARDPMEEFFASKLTEKKYSRSEIETLDQSNSEGWRDHESIPLSEVKRKLTKLAGSEDILKWQHFMLPKTTVHTALFFSPQKDKWFYIELNPDSGECRRTIIYTCKEVAEFKRKRRILTWIPLTTNPIVI